jgi:3-phosphoshikimate 1-carboxyvinyltransferase
MSSAKPLQSKKSPPLTGIAIIPGDKSISHRALMFGAMTEGETIIGGLLEGEDVYATAEAMRSCGADITREGAGNWRVNGIGHNFRTPKNPIDMGNSGTSTRLIMGLLTGHPVTATMTGDASLSKRPMGRVITPLEQIGAKIEATEGGKLPLTITGTDNPKAITYELPIASAQVKSAILLAGLNANGITTVIEDHPTRDHTENMLRYFGIDLKIEKDGTKTAISVKGGQTLQPGLIQVPRDPSSAAFPVVAAIINEGSDITCENIGLSPTRDGLYQTLIEMGADITITNKRTEAGEIIANLHIKGTGPLTGIEVPASRVPSMIDEFPILAIAASCAQGTTHMTGLAELRVKESDRLAVMAEGLKACGVNLEMGEDSLTIHGNGKPPQGGTTVKTHLDHRIAMSFLILGTVTDQPVSIDDGAPIQTSFPNFIALMTELGAKIGPASNE